MFTMAYDCLVAASATQVFFLFLLNVYMCAILLISHRRFQLFLFKAGAWHVPVNVDLKNGAPLLVLQSPKYVLLVDGAGNLQVCVEERAKKRVFDFPGAPF